MSCGRMSPMSPGPFERDFDYTMPNPLLRLLDRLVLRRRVEAESAETLRRLKDVLEKRVA
jgi:hypothetical protein